MDFVGLQSPGTAFAVGLITSLHCAGMCGPLACSLVSVRRNAADTQVVSCAYHVARLAGYATLGAVAGGLGRTPLAWFSQSALRWLPWLMVLVFVALALRWDRFLPKPLLLTRYTWKWQMWLRARSPVEAAVGLGLATPLLPCGPLYIVTAVALLSGSALRGVEMMLAFGLGTVPLLWLAQAQFQWVRSKLSPLWLNRVRATLALASALVISWRLRATLGFNGPDPMTFICF